MCGIFGYIGNKEAFQFVESGLKKLEYRGYDSYGSAFLTTTNDLFVHKAVGSIRNNYAGHLKKKIGSSFCGIGHVRWATNGNVNKLNAHPHIGSKNNIALVHNGIISNQIKLKNKLLERGYQFTSDTDTEVLAHWIDFNLNKYKDIENSVKKALEAVEGFFAVCFLVKGQKVIVSTKRDVPLYLGACASNTLIASSLNVLDELLNEYEFVDIEDDDVILIDGNKNKSLNWINNVKTYAVPPSVYKNSTYKNGTVTDGEMFEQKYIISNFEPRKYIQLDKNRKLVLFGCGSSHNAAMISKYFFKDNLFNDIEVLTADELKYSRFFKNANYIGISQSGETKDVLDTVKALKREGIKCYAITNSHNTSLEKNADQTFQLECGKEEGVAATKTVTGTLLALFNLAYQDNPSYCKSKILEMQSCISSVFSSRKSNLVPKYLSTFEHIFLLGNGIAHYVNIEGSLKLKEMASVFAEAIYATEVKHGPLTLINSNSLSIFTLLEDVYKRNIIDNIAQIASRKGKVLLLLNKKINLNLDLDLSSKVKIVLIPGFDGRLFGSISLTIFLQFIAWQLGKLRGVNIDRPRNLAKSVTV